MLVAARTFLFRTFSSSTFTKSLGKRVVVNFQLGDLLILISCHRNKLGFFEDVGSEGGVGQLENVAGPHKVEPGLVLVHRVQDRLSKKRGLEIVQKLIVWGYLLR